MRAFLIIPILITLCTGIKAADSHFTYQDADGTWKKEIDISFNSTTRELIFLIPDGQLTAGVAYSIKIGAEVKKPMKNKDIFTFIVPNNSRLFKLTVYKDAKEIHNWIYVPTGYETSWISSREMPSDNPGAELSDNTVYGPRPLMNNNPEEEEMLQLDNECKGGNHRLYIDASNNVTNNKGVLLQRKECDEAAPTVTATPTATAATPDDDGGGDDDAPVYKHAKSIRIGGNLSIWIDNINVNKFEYIKATSSFLDFEYSNESLTFFNPAASTGEGRESADGNGIMTATATAASSKTLETFVALYKTLIQAKKDFENHKGYSITREEIKKYKAELDEYIGGLGLGSQNQWSEKVQKLVLPPSRDQDRALALQVDYLYDYISNYPTSIKTSILPIQTKNGDKIKITIVAKEKGSSTERELGTYSFRMKGGFKLGISPTVIFHGLKDERYFYQDSTRLSDDETQTESFVVLKQDDQSNKFGGYGIGTMLNGYFRTGSLLNIGFGVGTFVPFEDSPRFRFLSGLSFEIAEEKYRFSLHAGLVLGKTKTLMPRFHNQQEFDVRPQGDILRDEWAQSWFIGFGYGLPINTGGK